MSEEQKEEEVRIGKGRVRRKVRVTKVRVEGKIQDKGQDGKMQETCWYEV